MNPLISPARFKPAVRSGGSIEYGITPLINGQAYIDVVLVTTLSDTIWDTVCSVVNTTDATPLNIWPGIITAKSTTGFTVQLSGVPDSANYFLHWTIIPGAAAPAVIATTYVFSGPSSGLPAIASTPFTVHLLSGETVPAPVTVTPHDGGGGGTFAPATMNLTTAAPSATFTYTPASTGVKTISTTNGGGLSNPPSLTYTAAVPFDPTAIAGLTLWLKADAMALSDGASVGTWIDSSGSGYNFSQANVPQQPIYKGGIVNGKPVVRFDGIDDYLVDATNPIISGQHTIFAVVNPASNSVGSHDFFMSGITGTNFSVILRRDGSDWHHYQTSGSLVVASDVGGVSPGTWTQITADWNGTNIHIWRNGTLKDTTGATLLSSIGNMNVIGAYDISNVEFWDGDVAEILVYNSALSTTDRQNVENYLKTKYGL